MATTYSTYTGGTGTSSNIYTVPSGKVSKIILTDLRVGNGRTIQIGTYYRINNAGTNISSQNGSITNVTNGDAIMESEDILVARATNNVDNDCMWIKRSHILTAGQSIRFTATDYSNGISFVVIEEDV